jgi:hypothetical protein
VNNSLFSEPIKSDHPGISTKSKGKNSRFVQASAKNWLLSVETDIEEFFDRTDKWFSLQY